MGLLVEFLFLGRHPHIFLGGIPLWVVDCDWYYLPLCWSLSTLLLVVLTLLWEMFELVHSCSVMV